MTIHLNWQDHHYYSAIIFIWGFQDSLLLSFSINVVCSKSNCINDSYCLLHLSNSAFFSFIWAWIAFFLFSRFSISDSTRFLCPIACIQSYIVKNQFSLIFLYHLEFCEFNAFCLCIQHFHQHMNSATKVFDLCTCDKLEEKCWSEKEDKKTRTFDKASALFSKLFGVLKFFRIKNSDSWVFIKMNRNFQALQGAHKHTWTLFTSTMADLIHFFRFKKTDLCRNSDRNSLLATKSQKMDLSDLDELDKQHLQQWIEEAVKPICAADPNVTSWYVIFTVCFIFIASGCCSIRDCTSEQEWVATFIG